MRTPFLAVLILLAVASSASAAETPPTLPPVPPPPAAARNTKAARTIWQPEKGRLIFEGGVSLDTPDFKVSADRVVVWMKTGDAAPTDTTPFRRAEVVAEGNVTFTRGDATVWADRVYFNADTNEILATKAQVKFAPGEQRRGGLPAENPATAPSSLPIYGRADEIWRSKDGPWVLRNGTVTTCSYGHPHVWVQARKTLIHARKEGEKGPRVESYGVSVWGPETIPILTKGGTPLIPWIPYLRDIQDIPIRRLTLGSSKGWGFYVLSEWDILKVMNLAGLSTADPPLDLDATIALDYYSDRGFGKGLALDYQGRTFEGDFLGYHLRDSGYDQNRYVPEARDRYWVRLRHRQQLPWDVRMDIRVDKSSDRGFIPEFFELESKEGDLQETYVHFRRMGPDTKWFGLTRPNWAATLTAKFHVNDFQGESTYLPRAAFYIIGEPVRGTPLTWTSKTEAAVLKWKPGEPDNRRQIDSDGELLPPPPHIPKPDDGPTTLRFDTVQQLDLPIKNDYFKLVPFAGVRFTAWSQHVDGHGIARFAPFAGFRASTQFARAYPNVRSSLLGIDGIRHIVIPEIRAYAVKETTQHASEFIQHDAVDSFDDYEIVALRLRNLLETHRNGRVVEFFTADLEARLFRRADRDNAGSGVSFLHRIRWRATEALTFTTDGEFASEPEGYIRLNTGLEIHPPDKRFLLVLQDRYIRKGPHTLIASLKAGLSANWMVVVDVRQDIAKYQPGTPDTQKGDTQFALSFIRDCHDYDVTFFFSRDTGKREGGGFGISLSPHGLGSSLFDRRRTSRFESTAPGSEFAGERTSVLPY